MVTGTTRTGAQCSRGGGVRVQMYLNRQCEPRRVVSTRGGGGDLHALHTVQFAQPNELDSERESTAHRPATRAQRVIDWRYTNQVKRVYVLE